MSNTPIVSASVTWNSELYFVSYVWWFRCYCTYLSTCNFALNFEWGCN
nr:uncharacterized protein CTRU02_01224 [Colletotrichum truncatum]KAF6800819.1 hypothetical protein CTRU02_01224 [Colletotrichum truncatum]